MVFASGAGDGALLVVLGAPHVIDHVGGEGVDLRTVKQQKRVNKN